MSTTSDRPEPTDKLFGVGDSEEGQSYVTLHLSAIRDLDKREIELCCPECGQASIGISAIIPSGLTTVPKDSHLDDRSPKPEWGPERAITVLFHCRHCELDSLMRIGGSDYSITLTCPPLLRP